MNHLVCRAISDQSSLATNLVSQKSARQFQSSPEAKSSSATTTTVGGPIGNDRNATDSSSQSPPRPYRCDQCAVGFKLKVHLKKHNLYKHSDEYPCACGVCGKRFKDSSAVRLHERIHSTARPFECQRCGKSFKTRENLWGHRHRGPCDRGITETGCSGGNTIGSICGMETDGRDEVAAAIDGLGPGKPSNETATPLSSPKGHETAGRSLHTVGVFRANSQQFVGGAEQIVVRAPNGTKFLAQLSAATTSTDFNCNTPSAMQVCSIGVGSTIVAPNGGFVPVGWTASTHQQLHQPLSTIEVPSLIREATSIAAGRRLLGRQSIPSSTSEIGAVVAAAARTISMMQMPPVSGQTWLSSTSVSSGMPPLALPTAVVAPIKREQPEIGCSSSVGGLPTADANGHPLYIVQSSTTAILGAEKHSLPPFSTLISSASYRKPNEAVTSPVSTMSVTASCSTLLNSSPSSSNFDRFPTTTAHAVLEQSCVGGDVLVRLPGIDQLFPKTGSTVDNPAEQKNDPDSYTTGYHVINLTGSPRMLDSFQPQPLAESKLLEIVDDANLGVWKRRQHVSNTTTPGVASQFQTYGIKLGGHNDSNLLVTCLPPPPPYPGLGIGNHQFDFSESATKGHRSQQFLSIVGKR